MRRKFFASAQERDGVFLRQQDRCRQVVGLHALAQKVGIISGLVVAAQVRREGLQDRRTRVAGSGLLGRQVDASVALVGDRAGRMRQVADVVQRESEVARHVGDDLVRDRAAGVADRCEQLGGHVLELAEVVVAGAHRAPQLGVRPPRLLRGGRSLAVQPLDLLVEREDRAQVLVALSLGNAHGFEPERCEHRSALCALDRDLECGALVRRLGRQQVVDRDGECGCDGAQQGRAAARGCRSRSSTPATVHGRSRPRGRRG